MKKIIVSALVALTVLVGLVTAPQAQAFQNVGYGGGTPSFTGGWWPKTGPDQHNVHWCYNGNSYSVGAAGYAQAAVEQAAAAWNAASGSTHVTLIQDANCNVLTGGLCGGVSNNVNTVTVWAGIGSVDVYGQTCLKYGDWRQINEADIDIDFGSISRDAAAYPGQGISVVTTAMHEFGHLLGLSHDQTNEPDDATEGIQDPCRYLQQTMCAGPNGYPRLNSIGWDDIAGLLYIYTKHDGAGRGYQIGALTPWYYGRHVGWADVNGDGGLGSNDSQLIFTWFQNHDSTGNSIEAIGGTGPNSYDLDGNGVISPTDAQLAFSEWKAGGGTCGNGP